MAIWTKEPKKKPGHRLRVLINEETKEIEIEGNKSGLEYLAKICLSMIGQPPGPNHWHFGEAFGTLDEKSSDLIICYREELEP